ncbi:MAG: S41 family peptidase [Acidobacteriaceae bacterium]|nr:S41 family peptidase [Acidobacteriaceae bacterium]
MPSKKLWLRTSGLRRLATAVLTLSCIAAAQQPAQKVDAYEADRARMMLHQIYANLQHNYYDPTFHGVDLAGNMARTEKLLTNVHNPDEAYFLLATFVSTLNDSHTTFIPPDRIDKMDRGFAMDVIGEAVFVTDTRPGSDASTKLHPGDRIVSINGISARRKSYDLLTYTFDTLIHTPELKIEVADTNGKHRTEVVKAQFKQGVAFRNFDDAGGVNNWKDRIDAQNYAHWQRHQYIVYDNAVLWHMPSFETSDDVINTVFAKAHKAGTLVIDLRGNGGGDVEILKTMVQHLFDHPVEMYTEVGRKSTKKRFSPTGHFGRYDGKLIVLIDAQSASASEAFARIIQLEHRGTVIGDRSAGELMESKYFEGKVGDSIFVSFGTHITVDNIIMSDGHSIENAGVFPDELALPSAADIADGKDPVLAKALTEAGVKIDPAQAGKLIAFEWPPF